MERKISLQFLLISLISSILVVAVCCFTFLGVIRKQVFSDLKMTAQLVAENINDAEKLDGLDTRVTVISKDGTVVYDNTEDRRRLENHANREEVKKAVDSGFGTALRRSDTAGKSIFYYAQKLEDGTVLRVSTQSENVLSVFFQTLPLTLIALLAVFAVCAFLSAALTKTIVKPIKKLSEVVDSSEFDDYGYEELVPLVRKIKSQRVEIEKQLSKVRAEKEKITTIMENMAEGLILFGADKNAVLINEAAVKLLKTDSDAPGERIYYITRNPEMIDCVKSAEKGDSSSMLFEESGKTYQFTASPVTGGGSGGVVCLMVDVTEKTGLIKLRQEFTANVSHELKTPLTSVMGYSELIENEIAGGGDVLKFAGKIRKEAERMLTLINDILKLSKLDEIAQTPAAQRVDLKEIAVRAAESLSLLANDFKVSVAVSGEGEADGDPGELLELVFNLCENAIRYNKPGGRVDISVEGKKLTVSDNGIGIPKDKQQRVFERFYRVDKSRSKESGGTGLGLAIVKHIAARQGAQIELESEEGKGTRVRVTFK